MFIVIYFNIIRRPASPIYIWHFIGKWIYASISHPTSPGIYVWVVRRWNPQDV